MSTSSSIYDNQSLKHTTLPRQILKWIQGLDLSYSVKDFRRDLKNGFLIAQIFSRYHPGRIQMHSFDNSQNSDRKKNNWKLIAQFLNKNQITISNKQFDRIEHGDSEQLYQFMCRVYTTLTQRKLSLQPLMDINTQSIRNDNLTSSFLMKATGIQKLQGSINHSLLEQQQLEETFQKQTQNNQVKKPNLLKIPSKQITPNIQNSDNSVNMKSINIRQVNQKTSGQAGFDNQLSKGQNGSKKQSYEEQQQKSIMNYFDDIIESNLEDQVFEFNKSFFDMKYSYNSNFVRKINSINPDMVCLFFQQVIASKQGLISKIFKYQQETWKFYVFMKSCLHELSSSHPGFQILLDLLFEYLDQGQDKYLTQQFLNQYWYPLMIKQIKISNNKIKRSKIIKLLSRVTRQQSQRKDLIMKFRQSVNNITLFMQFLSILIQGQKFEESGKSLIDIYINYANLHLLSNCKSLKSYSLKIYMKISSENFVFGLKTFKPHYQELRKTEDWQNMSQIILILGILLTRITQSKQYLNLVKQPTTLSRTYNPENQKMSNQMKQQIQNICNLIYSCSLHNSPIVKKISLDVVVPLMDVHPILSKIFLEIYLLKSKQEQQQILGQTRQIEIVEQSKTQLQIRNVGKEELIKVGVDILSAINQYYKISQNSRSSLPSIQNLISVCLQNMNEKDFKQYYSEQKIQRILSQLFVTIIQKLNEPYKKSISNFIQILSNEYFSNRTKIRKHNQIFAQFIINNISNLQWDQFFVHYFKTLSNEYSKTFNPLIKQFIEHFKAQIINSKNTKLNQLAKFINTQTKQI